MVAVVSDTHMPKGARVLPDPCRRLLRRSELIVHAGDWWKLEVLEMFEAIGPPVIGVRGNVDDAGIRGRLPERAEFELAGITVGVIHDAGPKRGRLARMRRAFPGASAVIFGHSHIPLLETDPDDGFTIFNPGSPTERRRAPARTMGTLAVSGGDLEFAHVEV